MASHMWRDPRTGIFHFRIRIPSHLREQLNATEIKKSTYTRDRAFALLICARLYLEFRENVLSKKSKKRDELGRVDYIRYVVTKPDGSTHSVEVDRHDGNDEKEEAEIKRLTEEWTTPIVEKDRHLAPAPTKTLLEVIDEHTADQIGAGRWSAKTQDENAAILQEFFEIIRFVMDSDDPLFSDITRSDLSKTRDVLKMLPPNRKKNPKFKSLSIAQIHAMNIAKFDCQSPTNVKKKVTRVSGLFNWAKRAGICTNNIAEGLITERAAKTAINQRLPFTDDDLKTLFETNHWQKSDITMHWVALIGLYTGMRLNEICQLEVADIDFTNKAQTINVNDNGELKKLKTSASTRMIPVHAKLINLGFKDYCASIKTGRLFPKLKYKEKDGFSGALSKKFSRRLNTLGLKPEDNPRSKAFHSFRHTFSEKLKINGIDETITAALAGHAHTSITYGRYGGPESLERLSEAVNTIDYSIDFARPE